MDKFKECIGNREPLKVAFIDGLIHLINNSQHQSHQGLTKETDQFLSSLLRQVESTKLIFPRSSYQVEALSYFFKLSLRKGVKKYPSSNFQQIKQATLRVCKDLRAIFLTATLNLAKNFLQLLGGQAVLLTGSYSNNIKQSLKLAHSTGVYLKVYVCQTCPMKEGVRMKEDLQSQGIQCRVIRDNQVCRVIEQVDMIVLGADCVLQDGSVLTRQGLRSLCLLGNRFRKPTYILTETTKFTRRAQAIENWNNSDRPGLEVIKQEEIQGVVSQLGICRGCDTAEQLLSSFSRKKA